MSQTERKAIEAAITMCLEMRALLQPHGSRHIMLLLDMLLFDLGRQIAAFRDPKDGPTDTRSK